jgi:hypothetical protein
MFSVFSENKPSLPIATSEQVFRDYLCVVGQKSVLSLTHYGGSCSRREVAEIILVQQMLALGGFDYEFSLESGYYSLRERKLIRSGLLLIGIDSIWQSEANEMADDVYISPPIINAGEYQAGFYTSTHNDKVLATTSIKNLKALSVVSNKQWTIDWKTLKSTQFNHVKHEGTWLAQARLIEKELADVMLAPFSNRDDLSYNFKDILLTPIPGFLIELPESRHIIVSKKHPLGESAFNALIKGMEIMRNNGTITKAYEDAGFLNKNVKHWQVVK